MRSLAALMASLVLACGMNADLEGRPPVRVFAVGNHRGVDR